MSENPDTNKESDLEKLKLLRARQDAEATLHWSRNSYFLVVNSLLLVAYSQKPVEGIQLTYFQMLLSLLGAFLNFIWLLIQHRSSKYTLYYKSEARKCAKSTNNIEVYPEKLGRSIEMRKLAYFLPLSFLVIWVAFIIMGLQVAFPSN